MQEIGETRQAMREKLLSEKLYKIAYDAHREKSLDKFWIFLSYKPDVILDCVIREGVIVTNRKPQKMLNSMCFFCDWIKGVFNCEWILPMDLGVDIQGSSNSEFVVDSVKSLGPNILV